MGDVSADLVTEQFDTAVGSIELQHGGSGPPLVYLHSAMGEGVGSALIPELARSFTVYAPMFCGFAGSDGLEQIDDIEDAAFHVLDLLDRLELEQPVLAGLSLGGWMSAELATRWPDRIDRLVLVNPAGLYVKGHEIADIFGRAPSAMAEDLFADPDHPVSQIMRQMENSFSELTAGTEIPFELVKPQFQAMAATAKIGWDPYLHNPKLARRLGRIDCPTLIIHGEHDTLIPRQVCEVYADGIPGATLEVMDHVAHMIPLEDPARLAERMVEFAS
jgi:pimeloyl-ACP methyl ester carboxylesterase